MEEYIKWLENMIEVCLEDKDLQREHWAFCQALKKCRELSLCQPDVVEQSEQCNHIFERVEKGGKFQGNQCDCGEWEDLT